MVAEYFSRSRNIHAVLSDAHPLAYFFYRRYIHPDSNTTHCNGNCDEHLYPATVRVPDARSAADAPGGEHDLADR